MANVVVKYPESVKVDISLVPVGTYFLGQISNDVHLRTRNGSTRLSDGQLFSTEWIATYGPVKVVPDGSSLTILT